MYVLREDLRQFSDILVTANLRAMFTLNKNNIKYIILRNRCTNIFLLLAIGKSSINQL